ncbi:hypothetical protein G0U57_010780, partial [Chelydra serpentina]
VSETEEHDCPIPSTLPPNIITPFKIEERYKDAKVNQCTLWVVDGSSLLKEGKPATGFAVLDVEGGKMYKGTIKQQSAQAAEIVAKTAELEHAEPSDDITICTDSDWVLKAFLDWMPVWKARGMKSSEGNPVAYAEYLMYAWDLAEKRKGDTYLFNVKAHKRNQAEITVLSNQVDQMAKQAAKSAPLWEKQLEKISGLTEADPLKNGVDIIRLQQQDPEIDQLLRSSKAKSWIVFKNPHGLIMDTKGGS